MRFKVKMECVCMLDDKDLKEDWGTLDPEKLAKKETPSIEYTLSQPMFEDMKVSIEPIGEKGQD